MTAHCIYIDVVGLGERGHRYRVTYEGRTLIEACRVPGLDACRALLALGITGKLEMRRSDADNRIKVLLDSLVEHRLIEDDSKVAAVSVAWSGDVPPGRVRIEVRRARAPKRMPTTVAAILRTEQCNG